MGSNRPHTPGLINFAMPFFELTSIKVQMIILFSSGGLSWDVLSCSSIGEIIISGNDTTCIRELKGYLFRTFKTKDHVIQRTSLGLNPLCNLNGIHVHQQKYAEDLLSLAHLTDFKISRTPLELNAKFHKKEGSPLYDTTLYCCPVGSWLYLMMTCPDVASVVQIVNQFAILINHTFQQYVIYFATFEEPLLMVLFTPLPIH